MTPCGLPTITARFLSPNYHTKITRWPLDQRRVSVRRPYDENVKIVRSSQANCSQGISQKSKGLRTLSTKSLRRPYDYRTTALRFVSERIVTPYGRHRTGSVRYPLIYRLNGDRTYYRCKDCTELANVHKVGLWKKKNVSRGCILKHFLWNCLLIAGLLFWF